MPTPGWVNGTIREAVKAYFEGGNAEGQTSSAIRATLEVIAEFHRNLTKEE